MSDLLISYSEVIIGNKICMLVKYRVLCNSKFGVINSNFFIHTTTFLKVPVVNAPLICIHNICWAFTFSIFKFLLKALPYNPPSTPHTLPRLINNNAGSCYDHDQACGNGMLICLTWYKGIQDNLHVAGQVKYS